MLLIAALARAGTFPVYVCGALGQNNALAFSENTNHIAYAQWCGGLGIQVWSQGSVSGAQAGGWWFHAPPGTTITQISSNFRVSAWDGWVAHWATSESGAGDPYPGSWDCVSTDCDSYTPGGDMTAPVSNATEIGFGIWCHAASCPANDNSSWFGPAASDNVYDATITVDDPAPPSFGIDQGPLAGRPTWVSAANAPSGGWYVMTTASDPAGVCGFEISVGSEDEQANVSPNYTVPAPCGASVRQTTFALNPCALPDGSYVLSESATNPAGMVGYGPLNGQTINIDCTPPTTEIASAPAPGRWYSTPQQVTFVGSDNFSGVGELRCSDGAHSGSTYTETVSAQGSTTVSCQAIDNAENVGNTAQATVNIDYQQPTVAFSGPPQSEWVSGAQTVTVTGSEQQQLSGVASVSCSVDGGLPHTVTGAKQDVTIAGDGVHTLSCSATSGAGVTGPTSSYTVHIDSEPPSISFSDGPSQSQWYTTAQAITVSAVDQPGLSGVNQIVCTLGAQTTAYAGDNARVTVQPPGGELTCRAEDNAGNWSPPQAWNFLIDDTPPTGAFEPPDPSNPDLITVQVADSGSGVAGGQIQIETVNGWQNLPTQFDGTAGTLTATVPDNGTLPDGTYQLRALVWDVAGNEATITDEPAAGRPAAVTLPLRIVTELLVAHEQVQARRCSLRRVVLRRAEPARGGRAHGATRALLMRHCQEVAVPAATERIPQAHTAVRLGYGQRTTLVGLLETVDGTPLGDQAIHVSAQADGWGADGSASLTTDPHGRFVYTLPPGASRTVTFSYSGDSLLRPSLATAAVYVVGRSTIEVGANVRAGADLRISGRVEGGFVPPGGVLVQLWYRVRGVPTGFAPFEHAIATDARGRWSITFPVALGARGYTYLFKAVIPHEAGWPFLTTSTRTVARHVS
ncbi:MAG TPA: hypothetical protein VKV27_12315 [Solirubrobacteraceae bacterium]|nr:hypothetical protein [Solirubrobacteraceae bacterium]